MKASLLKLVRRFPRMKRLVKSGLQIVVPRSGVSTHYVEMADEEIGSESARLKTSWKDNELPGRQRKLVDQQLSTYRRGESVGVFDTLIRSLRGLQRNEDKMQVLEIGCSSGYYSEVFEIAGLTLEYTGCDYSNAFIDMARQRYPGLRFDVQDATMLDYADRAFDVVISGCCLLHIPEYAVAVAETVRVADRYVIFHRTPVVLGQPNKYYRKQAYGVETVEIHFNEPQFLDLLSNNGLELLITHTLNEAVSHGVGSATRTYVCGKRAA